eukprot:Selendium_serpulae@DN5575_c0_g2_i1.p1
MVDIVCPGRSWAKWNRRFNCGPTVEEEIERDIQEDAEVYKAVMGDRLKVELIEFFKYHKLPVEMAIDFIDAGVDSLDSFAQSKPCTTNYVEGFVKTKWLPGHRVRIEQVIARAKDNVGEFRGRPKALPALPDTPTQHQSLVPARIPPRVRTPQCYDHTSSCSGGGCPKSSNCPKKKCGCTCENCCCKKVDVCPTLERKRLKAIEDEKNKPKVTAVPLPSECPYGCEDCPYHPNGYKRVVEYPNAPPDTTTKSATEEQVMPSQPSRKWKPSWRRRREREIEINVVRDQREIEINVVRERRRSATPPPSPLPPVDPIRGVEKSWRDAHPEGEPFDFDLGRPVSFAKERRRARRTSLLAPHTAYRVDSPPATPPGPAAAPRPAAYAAPLVT